MALINWDAGLSVSVNEIDQQHQKLIAMINDLNDAMRQGKGRNILIPVINGLITYTATHFKVEEKYFDQFNYADAQPHKDEHAAFVKKVIGFRDRLDSGQLGLPIDVMFFLSSWLTTHIKGTDKKYSACFNANGLK
jgi:hemerythrin